MPPKPQARPASQPFLGHQTHYPALSYRHTQTQLPYGQSQSRYFKTPSPLRTGGHHAFSQSAGPYGPYPANSRTPSAFGFLPQSTANEYAGSIASFRSSPVSTQQIMASDRPPSVPLRLQKTPRLSASPMEDDTASNTTSPSTHTNPIPTLDSATGSFQPSPARFGRNIGRSLSRTSVISSQTSGRPMVFKRNRNPGSQTTTSPEMPSNERSPILHGTSRFDQAGSSPSTVSHHSKANTNPSVTREPTPTRRVAKRPTGTTTSLQNAAVDSHSASNSSRGLKRAGEQLAEIAPPPKRVIKFNAKGGSTPVSALSSQSTSTSQGQFTVTPTASESILDPEYGTRHVLDESGPNAGSPKHDAKASPAQDACQGSSAAIQHDDMQTLRTESIIDNILSSLQIDYSSSQTVPSEPTQEENKLAVNESSNIEPDASTPRTGPTSQTRDEIDSQKELPEESVAKSDSRDQSVLEGNRDTIVKKPHYSSVGTQHNVTESSDAECQTADTECRPPSRSDDRIVAGVVRTAWTMMDECTGVTTREIMATLAKVKTMSSSRLKPHEADSIDWLAIWTLHSHTTLEELGDEVLALNEII